MLLAIHLVMIMVFVILGVIFLNGKVLFDCRLQYRLKSRKTKN